MENINIEDMEMVTENSKSPMGMLHKSLSMISSPSISMENSPNMKAL